MRARTAIAVSALALAACGPPGLAVPSRAGVVPAPPAATAPSGETPPTAWETPESLRRELAYLRQMAREHGDGFIFWLDSPHRTDTPQVFRTTAGRPFRARAIVGNYEPAPMRAASLCLVDYAQRPWLAGSPATVHRAVLPARTEASLDVAIAELPPGVHDVVFLTFFEPDGPAAAPGFSSGTRPPLSFHRITVVVGEASAPRPAVTLARFGAPDRWAREGLWIYGLTRGEADDVLDAPWREEAAAPGAAVSYRVTLNNPSATATTFALVALLDYGQVPLATEHRVFYGELAPWSRATVAGALTAPAARGLHELLVLRVDNPFMDLSAPASAAAPLSSILHGSERVRLTVR